MQSRSRLTTLVASLPAVSPNYRVPAVVYWPPLATSPSVSTNRYVGNEDKDLSYHGCCRSLKLFKKYLNSQHSLTQVNFFRQLTREI